MVDIGFPIFLFILGLLLPCSWQRRRAASGITRTVLHFLRRYALLITFGLAGNAALGQNPLHWWSVLSTIGLAGIVALPFTPLKPVLRLAAGGLLVTFFELVKSLNYEDWLLHNDQGQLGGPLGCIAWAGVILIGSSHSHRLGDFKRLLTAALLTGTGLTFSSLILGFVIPLSKQLVTVSYVLISSGIACFGLAAAMLVDRLTHSRPALVNHLMTLGANPLVVYMLSGLLSEGYHAILPTNSPTTALISAGMIYVACSLIARLLFRHNLVISL